MQRAILRWFSAVGSGCRMRSWRWNTASIQGVAAVTRTVFLMTFHPLARASSSWACVTFTQYKLADVWAAPWTGSAKRVALIGHWSAVVTPTKSRLPVIRSGTPDIYKHGDLPPSSLPSNIQRTITWARMGGRLCRLRSWLISIEKNGRGEVKNHRGRLGSSVVPSTRSITCCSSPSTRWVPL